MVDRKIREVVATFARSDDLERSIEALGSAGFDRSRLSVLGSVGSVEKELGHRLRRTDDAADERKAVDVLRANKAENVEAHEIGAST